MFYKRLADLLSVKKSLDYSTVMSWLRCHLSFSLLRSAIDEHDPAVVVQPIMVRLTLLWPKVKCAVVCRCISVLFFWLAQLTSHARGGGKGCRLPRDKKN